MFTFTLIFFNIIFVVKESYPRLIFRPPYRHKSFVNFHERKLDDGLQLLLSPEQMTRFKIWPQGTVLYMVDEYSFDRHSRDWLRNYLNNLHTVINLSFNELRSPPVNSQSRWVLFINRVGQLDCVDYTMNNFTGQGTEKVVMGYDCFYEDYLAGIVLALAGVPPQHNAPFRDNYIEVHTQNILPEKVHFFNRLTDNDWVFDKSYDMNSAGHYDMFMYSKNGCATITLKKNNSQNDNSVSMGFSTGDIAKIQSLYNNISDAKNETPRKCKRIFGLAKVDFNYRNKKRTEVDDNKDPNINNSKKGLQQHVPNISIRNERSFYSVEMKFPSKNTANSAAKKLKKTVETLLDYETTDDD